MTFHEAVELASREERFRATVYAMNTLLIEKGIYSKGEFEARFVEWTCRQAPEGRKSLAQAGRPG